MRRGVWTKNCDTSACVEVMASVEGDRVSVRSSLDPDPEVHFTPEQWKSFLAGVANGEFTLD